MDIVEKRDFIHSHLHIVREAVIDDIYNKMLALFNESLIEESEEEIKNGNLISQESLKQEILNWRPTK
ncbi:MAG: hypothetical protein JEZ03_17115 [Bacteroidales bacterium]|nr:hypothetical protein [Bacteroidales bacterium]